MYNCLLGCLLWFMQPVLIEAITAPRMRVSPPCILLIARSGRCGISYSAVLLDICLCCCMLVLCCCMLVLCLYYAAACLYYAAVCWYMLLAYYVDMMYGCSLFITHTAYFLHSLRGVSFGVCDTHGHAWACLGTSLRGGCYSPFCMHA